MLENVTARLRPRSGWESQDLGLAMVRGIAGRLLGQWLVVLVPIWLALAVIFQDHPGWFFVIVWWLKPVYDRIPLFALGRKLFGEDTKLKDVLKAAPKLIFRNNLYFLTFGRFSLYRCFSMPVKILEGGRYTAYRRRVALLNRQSGSTVFWVTIAWWMTSVVGVMGMYLLVNSWMVDVMDDPWKGFWLRLFGQRGIAPDPFTIWLTAALYLIVTSLTEMFYLGSGFGLYLNSRSHLEGWDIEISFRSIAARLRQSGIMALLVGTLAFGWMAVSTSEARKVVLVEQEEKANAPQLVKEEAKETRPEEVIKKVKLDPDFKVHSETFDVPDFKPAPLPSSPGSGWLQALGVLGQLIFYGFWAAVVALICWLVYKYRHVFTREAASTNAALEDEGPKTVMGLNVAPEALPADIPNAAWERWQAGDARGALRLLYAGSISWMINRGGLPIAESDTEGDCIRHAAYLKDDAKTSYFSTLTISWIENAYGSVLPDEPEMSGLVKGWPFR